MSASARFSLKRQLLVWLLLPQLVLWLMGGALAFRVALVYAEKAIDQSLTQSVRALARQVKPLGSGLLVDFPRAAQSIIEQDPQDRVTYMVSSPPGSFLLGNGMLPAPRQTWRLALTTPCSTTWSWGKNRCGWPWLISSFGDGPTPQLLRVQVAKSLVVQQNIARELVVDVLFPLLMLGALLSVLVYAGIQRGLAPLQRLEAQLANRSAASLSPIEMTQAPARSALAGHRAQPAARHPAAQPEPGKALSQRRGAPAAHAACRADQPDRAGHAESATQTPCRNGCARCTPARCAAPTWYTSCCHWPAPKPTWCCAPMDGAALAREVAREWTPRAVAANIDLGYEGEDSMPVAADPLLLREAMSNLIDNALRYAGRGATVTVRASQRGDACVLEVEDNGPGLSAQDISRSVRALLARQRPARRLRAGPGHRGRNRPAPWGRAQAQHHTPQGLVLRLVLPRPQPAALAA